jgi:60 kDa SS-A/Ro ribonucleoprotein
VVSAYVDAVKPVAPTVENHEGGKVYEADIWTRLRRFLILGAEGGTYYANQRDLTLKNVDAIKACLVEDGPRAVVAILEVSDGGLAPKNDPALFALALATVSADAWTRKHAFGALPNVARTGTHLLHFAAYRKALGGGWGRLMKRAVANWFVSKEPRDLAYQIVKYPSRDGWALADLLKLAHLALDYGEKGVVVPNRDDEYADVFRYAVGGQIVNPDLDSISDAMRFVGAAESLKHEAPWTPKDQALALIRDHRIPREALHTSWLNDPDVWSALLDDMPMTAMVRNLGKMTNVGLISRGSEAEKIVVGRLGDMDRIRKARVHPIALLAALKVYDAGKGIKGSLTWTPTKAVINALDEAFYLAFGNVEPTNKPILLGVDVSASMKGTRVNGMDYLDARTAAAAMTMVTLSVEPNAQAVAFSDKLYDLAIKPWRRLDDVVRIMDGFPHGGTFCSLPIRFAYEQEMDFSAFVVYTDSETMDASSRETMYGWRNRNQNDDTVSAWLGKYRKARVKNARMAVCAFASNGFTLADPNDPGQMDFVGLDASMPSVLAGFIAGKV